MTWAILLGILSNNTVIFKEFMAHTCNYQHWFEVVSRVYHSWEKFLQWLN